MCTMYTIRICLFFICRLSFDLHCVLICGISPNILFALCGVYVLYFAGGGCFPHAALPYTCMRSVSAVYARDIHVYHCIRLFKQEYT